MENIMSKNYVLIRDVIIKYHPSFIKSPDLCNYGLANPDIFNVERLIEEALAHNGGYNFINEAGRDYDDRWNSDCKTTTVIADGNSKTAIISSVENKIGSLRITIYNPFKDAVDFMYIPKKSVALLKEPSYGKNSYKEKIRARWNANTDYYNSCDKFRVDSFKKLATIGG